MNDIGIDLKQNQSWFGFRGVRVVESEEGSSIACFVLHIILFYWFL